MGALPTRASPRQLPVTTRPVRTTKALFDSSSSGPRDRRSESCMAPDPGFEDVEEASPHARDIVCAMATGLMGGDGTEGSRPEMS